ncbi:MAG: hypothetical protein K0U70_05260 [Actinomycetia bacterium]|nr:hypothetical protein [Actinomycetes bacterium]MCH9767188.1 hypothetical protein [Actinomycetes bacterium]
MLDPRKSTADWRLEMAYLTQAAAYRESSDMPGHYASASPVPKLEAMLQKKALEAQVLDLFWTGDD